MLLAVHENKSKIYFASNVSFYGISTENKSAYELDVPELRVFFDEIAIHVVEVRGSSDAIGCMYAIRCTSCCENKSKIYFE